MWAVVKNSGYAEDLEEFLRAFPDSVYAPEARVRLRHVQRRQAEASQPPETQVAVYIPEWPKTLRNSLGMEFVLIPAGTFQMGSSKGDDDERPVHTVTLSRPFYLGTTEVTQGQWAAVMGSNPSQYKGRDHPVEQVSWEEVQRFIKQLNAKEGSSLYRLPTEAEWEYAARAGTRSAWSFGDEERSLGTYAWYGDNAGNRTHPVGQKRPNGWGLYDMHGNVREWVQDWYGPYPSGAVTDPQGPRSGSNRVIRDGSWDNSASYCRSALRSSYAPDISSVDLGFRLLRTAP
jgi:formylglycine-generating enzyme required for sulfatase activity